MAKFNEWGCKLKNLEIKKKSTFREYAEAIIIALALAMLIRTFVVQAFKIPSGSMEPTLEIGDHILVNKFIFGIKIPFTSYNLVPFQKPKKGDVVVFIHPNDRDKDFIKRVAAVEGDTVQIVNKKLQINGAPVSDPHAVFKETGPLAGAVQKGDNFGPVRVPPEKIFVLGDNRDRSLDSRFWGFVPVEDVRGKAFIIYWSWDGQGDSPWYRLDQKIRWNRLGHFIE